MEIRRLILALGGAILVILFVIAAFSLGHQHGKTTKPLAPNLVNHTTDGSTVSFEIEGPVEADELHRNLIIIIGVNQRSIEADQTYTNQSIGYQSYPNNQAAFNDFMQALQNVGFTQAAKGKTIASELGMCPFGQRYVYQLSTNQQSTLRLWSDSCSDKLASFAGDAGLTRSLFQSQIPDFNQFETKLPTPKP